ncbi:MAG: CDP-glycerol glycerophosphotransferase family protein [Gammaproteobacteria bacterium]|nr:CDP-glycerol glycerophosphotransferase family protein [Gammaproteobacteria bacterium]
MNNFLKALCGYRSFKNANDSDKELVFYSESGQDWHHFRPLIEGMLDNYEHKIAYVSSDPNDPGLRLKDNKLTTYFIGSGVFRILFFQYLDTALCLLTMMDLDNFELKRSINNVHYVYLFHSLTSTHMVDNAESFDNYDSLLCAGPHQIKEIRARENHYKLPAKNLIAYGYHRLEELIELQYLKETPSREILIAPTWGENSILNTVGIELCEIVLDAGYILTVRPHYETSKRTPKVIEQLKNQFKGHENFQLVLEMGENDSLFTSDLLISDWSGIAIEYALGLGKPVAFIDLLPRVRNDDWERLNIEPLESSIRTKIGKIISPQDINSLPRVIEGMIDNRENFSQEIGQLREKYVYNLGQTRTIGPREIKQLLNQINH